MNFNKHNEFDRGNCLLCMQGKDHKSVVECEWCIFRRSSQLDAARAALTDVHKQKTIKKN